MRLCILSSGSKQNCFYLESDSAAVLIDAGMSFRALRGALAGIGREIGDVRGLFVSHEHIDHTRGLPMLAKHTTLPMYLHAASRAGIPATLPHAVALRAQAPVTVGDLLIQPFTVSHDAANTFGFRITHGARTLFLASDLGCAPEEIIAVAAGCHAIAIESNYDPLTLRTCGYPYYLQARIRGDHGHLANDDAVAFLHAAIGPETEHVFLLHLSENSNSHAHVQRGIDEHLAGRFTDTEFLISHRDRALPMVEI